MTPPEIQMYKFGLIQIDGKEYRRDVIILPHRVVPDWWREVGHSLGITDLALVLDELPPNLIVGQGHDGRLTIPEETINELQSRGFHLWRGPTTQAVARYQASSKQEQVAALLHLTC